MSISGVTYLLMAIGIVLIFFGSFLIFLDVIRRTSSNEFRESEKKVDVGGAIIVGPIPIVFGSNKSITKAMLLLAIILTVLVLIITIINYYLLVVK
ncbi:MAG: DUF131 domain-containing protein [Sulfolobales archaeon]